MFLFAAAFFGGLLLVPTYFQQVRGESALQAGWLMAVQGLGAMITMPIAGAPDGQASRSAGSCRSACASSSAACSR